MEKKEQIPSVGGFSAAVVADDLTGAADTGVQFCPVCGPVHLTGLAGMNRALEKGGSMAVFTDTRNLSPRAAFDRTEKAGRIIRSMGVDLVYKKMDSCLRGHWGVEIEALMNTLGAPAAFVAPAHPLQGRTTVNGVHLINGVPVAKMEMGKDPLSPVLHSGLLDLLSAQTRLGPAHVDLAVFDQGPGFLTDYLAGLLDSGRRIISFDAQTPEHLEAVAGLIRTRFPGVLPAGSAGLARALIKQRPARFHPARPPIKKWLFVCGSASGVMAGQVRALSRDAGFPAVLLDPAVLARFGEGERDESLPGDLARQWGKKGLVLSISPPDTPPGSKAADRTVSGLAEATARLVEKMAPEALFLSGGQTAGAVLDRMDASGILLMEEPVPGVVRGRLLGSKARGLPVFTKAGAFGAPDTLVRLAALFSGE